MIALEEEIDTEEGMKEYQAYEQGPGRAPQNKYRFELIRRLDDATQTTEALIDMQEETNRVMALAIGRDLTSEPMQRDGLSSEKMYEMRLQSKRMAEEYVWEGMLYTYRDVSDHELEAYIELYDSDAGRWAIKILNQARLTSMRDARQRLLGEVKKISQ